MSNDPESLIKLGYEARRVGKLDEALAFYGEAALLYRQRREPLKLAHALRHMADMQRAQGAIEAARAGYEEALAIYRANSDTPTLDLANAVRGYALLMTEADEREKAVALWMEAKDLYSAVNIDAGIQECEMQIRKLTEL